MKLGFLCFSKMHIGDHSIVKGVFRSTWGLIKQGDGPYDFHAILPILKKMGYAGIEVPVKFAMQIGKTHFLNALRQHDMKCILMVFTDGPVAPGDRSGIGIFGGISMCHTRRANSHTSKVLFLATQHQAAPQLNIWKYSSTRFLSHLLFW
jgi:hypothetical protein